MSTRIYLSNRNITCESTLKLCQLVSFSLILSSSRCGSKHPLVHFLSIHNLQLLMFNFCSNFYGPSLEPLVTIRQFYHGFC